MIREKVIINTQLCKIMLVIALIVCLLFVPQSARCATSTSESAQKMLTLTNQARQKEGLSAYRIYPTLQRAAEAKLADMITLGYFAHESPTYGDVSDLLSHFGLSVHCAENIAQYGSIEKAHAALMTSPAHRRNILARNFNAVGIAAAKTPSGGYMVVQIFAKV